MLSRKRTQSELQTETWKDPVIRAKRIAGMKKPKPAGFGEKESKARMGEGNPNWVPREVRICGCTCGVAFLKELE